MARAKATANTEPTKARARLPHPLDFGAPATSDPYHFKAVIPESSTGRVKFSEHVGLQATSADSLIIDRVLLDRRRGTAVRAKAQCAFNTCLFASGVRPGASNLGDDPVDRLVGEELCVLAWALEQIGTAKTPIAVRNGLALRPEGRWPLFGMAAISASAFMGDGKGKGWRVPLKHALGDMAQNDLLVPRARRGKDDISFSFGLLEDKTP